MNSSLWGWSLGLVLLGAAVGHAEDAVAAQRNVWQEVSAKARADADPKALWRELKQLPPGDLLLCGEQFCLAEKPDIERLVITTNAILSYHQKQTSYQDTAQAVAGAIRTSTCQDWVYGAMKWIESNHHYKQIPKEGMAAIAAAVEACLADATRPTAVRCTVLKQAASFRVFANFPAAARARLLVKAQELAKGEDTDLRAQAETSAQRMRQHMAEIEREAAAE